MDSLVLLAVIAECRRLAGDSVIEVLGSPERPAWNFALKGGPRLVIDLEGSSPVLYGAGWDDRPKGRSPAVQKHRPAARSGLTGLLEERLTGARLVSLDSSGLNRIAVLSFDRKDRFGDAQPTVLVVELLGAWGNLVVLDGPPGSGKIVDRLRSDRREAGGRRMDRGMVYSLPERKRADLLLDGPEALLARLEAGPLPTDADGWKHRLMESTEGMGSRSASEVLSRTETPVTGAGLLRAWSAGVSGAEVAKGAWLVTEANGAPRVVIRSPGEAPGDAPAAVRFESVSAAVEAGQARHLSRREPVVPDVRSRLAGLVAARRERSERLHRRLTEELHRRDDGSLDRLRAETLLAHVGQVPPGAADVTLETPHGDGSLAIPLDPRLGAAENAGRYFRESRKAEQAREELPVRIAKADKELETLRKWSGDLDALDPKDEVGLARLRQAIEGKSPSRARTAGGKATPSSTRGEAPAPAASARDRVPASHQPRRYELPGGWVILVGRTQEGNDYLTHRLAAPHDLWFHVHGASGSHVVLKAPDRKAQPDKSVLLAAAGLAALNSKARHASRVPVIYAEKRHVRKPRGSKPGLAAVTNEKSLMVKPAEPAEGSGRT